MSFFGVPVFRQCLLRAEDLSRETIAPIPKGLWRVGADAFYAGQWWKVAKVGAKSISDAQEPAK